MDVLISWSKPQSKMVAEALRDWLPTVLPGIKPWMSSKDIAKGKEWFRELQDFLGKASVCIICVTRENVQSPWLYYETGAIAAKAQDVLICPYLLGVDPSILTGSPLSQWQCAASTEEETMDLLRSLNDAMGSRHEEQLLKGNFKSCWSTLKDQLAIAQATASSQQDGIVETDKNEVEGTPLTEEMCKIILACSRGPFGYLTAHEATGGGIRIHADGTELYTGSDGREKSLWQDAIIRLGTNKLLRRKDREQFELTQLGWKLGDEIRFVEFDDADALSKMTHPTRELLVEASKDSRGIVMLAETLNDVEVTTNGKDFCKSGDMRDITVYKDAVIHLSKLDLIRDQGKGIVFEVTEHGYEVAEATDRLIGVQHHPGLSADARKLLLEAARDQHGIVLMTTLGDVQTNKKQFADRKNARSVATWRGAVEELHRLDFVEPRGQKGEVFAVTHKGFEYAEQN